LEVVAAVVSSSTVMRRGVGLLLILTGVGVILKLWHFILMVALDWLWRHDMNKLVKIVSAK
jgi:hypothetical protein